MKKMKIIDEILKSCRTDENYELDDVIEQLEKFKLAQKQVENLTILDVVKSHCDCFADQWDKREDNTVYCTGCGKDV